VKIGRLSRTPKNYLIALFSTVSMLVLTVLMVCMTRALVVNRRLSSESRTWPQASAEILESHVTTSSTAQRGTSYWPTIKYTYAIGGAVFTGDRVGFQSGYGSSAAQDAVARFSLGSVVPVWYRPTDPKTAVLEPNSWDGDLLLYFAIPFAFFTGLTTLFTAAVLLLLLVPERWLWRRRRR
jgi:hypothetical protein